jgi:hypothetical protein
MAPFLIGRREEDRLENLAVPSDALSLRDFQILFPYLLLGGVLITRIWLLCR